MRSVLIAALSLVLGGCSGGCPVTRDVPVHALASIDDALRLPDDVEAIRFEGVPHPELAGYKEWSVGGNRNTQSTRATAATIPVTSETWTKADPIPLWVRVDARSADDPPIQREIEAFVAAIKAGPVEVRVSQRLEADVDMDGTNAFQIGPRRAMDEHDVHSPVGTPIGSWPLGKGKLRLAE